MRQLIRADVLMFEGQLMQVAELKGYKPAWVPRSVWSKAIQHLDLGASNVEFYEDGQKWRALDPSVTCGNFDDANLHTLASSRKVRDGGKKGAEHRA